MEKTPVQATPKKKKNNKFLRILPWIGWVLFIIVVIIAAYFYTAKKPITVLSPKGTTVTVVVCDASVVSAYNTASKLEGRNGSSDPSVDIAGLNKLDTEIRSKSGYDQDPTCQTILFWNAILNNDTAKAGVALTAIENLHDSEHFADSNLENTTSISDMKNSLTATAADTQR